jgi:hypothetical protein
MKWLSKLVCQLDGHFPDYEYSKSYEKNGNTYVDETKFCTRCGAFLHLRPIMIAYGYPGLQDLWKDSF